VSCFQSETDAQSYKDDDGNGTAHHSAHLRVMHAVLDEGGQKSPHRTLRSVLSVGGSGGYNPHGCTHDARR
jgi:hypothetical protein